MQQSANEQSADFSEEVIWRAMHQDSHSLLAKLRRRSLHVFGWNAAVVLVFVGVLFIPPPHPDFRLLLGILDVVFVGLLGITYYRYHLMKRGMDFTLPIHTVLRECYYSVKRTLRIEELSTLAVLPISTIFGGALGRMISKGDGLNEILTDTTFLWLLLGLGVVLTPLGYWMTCKMNAYLFGGLLKRMKEDIEQLEVVN
jgi:hypothetical protein